VKRPYFGWLWLVAGMLAGFGLPGSWSAETDTSLMPPDIRRIVKRGELIVAMHREDGAPFYTLDKAGQLCGLDVDLAESIAQTLGVKVRFDRSSATFDGLVDFVAAGQADLAISCISRTPRRAMLANFSTPYVRLYQALLINRVKGPRAGNALPIDQWLNAPNIRIGTISGSSYMDFAVKDYPKAEIVAYEDFDKAAAAAVRGDVHAVIFDNSQITLWVQQHPEEVLYVQTRIMKDKEDPLSIVVNWQDAQLLNWINTYLATMEGEGRLTALRVKWLGKESSP